MSVSRERLVTLRDAMVEVAAAVGPMHAWWDFIFDIDCFLAGKKSFVLVKTESEWIELAEGLLHNSEVKGR